MGLKFSCVYSHLQHPKKSMNVPYRAERSLEGEILASCEKVMGGGLKGLVQSLKKVVLHV